MLQDLIESFSGIRGIYGKAINERLAQRYVFCYCQLFKNKLKKLIIGGDSRPSTPFLKEVMLKEFKNCGLRKIIDVGLVPIQVAEYAVLKFGADGGVYISASHNEPEYNGWKFLKKDGALLSPAQVEQLIALCHQSEQPDKSYRSDKPDRIDGQKEAIETYINFILEGLGGGVVEKIKKSNFKILADPNGGAAVNVLEKLFEKLGVKAEIINSKLGEFVRLIEPNVESLAPLAERMRTGEFDFACGFDCDADRVEFVLSPDSDFAKKMGSPVLSGNYVLALECDALLESTSNSVVVINDATSYLVRDVVAKHGATVKEVEVGETNVVKEMEKQKSLVGGEGSSSGGAIVPPIKCRDGIMAVVAILKMLTEKNKSLTEILEDYPQYFSERTKAQCSAGKAVAIKNEIEKHFRDQGYQIKKTGDETGGLKILFDKNSFLFFRQSKTEPGTFRIIADGDNQQKVKQILQKGIELFEQFNQN